LPKEQARSKGRRAAELNREAIRDSLQAGLTADQVGEGKWSIFFVALEEEARLEGELAAFEPTPENVVDLRDRRQLRWERIAVRVFGDARRKDEARALYDAAKGAGAAKHSYTGRGRRFPDMES
jgi:hypothetical protein